MQSVQNKEKFGKGQGKREKQTYNTEELLYFFKALLSVGNSPLEFPCHCMIRLLLVHF